MQIMNEGLCGGGGGGGQMNPDRSVTSRIALFEKPLAETQFPGAASWSFGRGGDQ